jgi:hypothetical protein
MQVPSTNLYRLGAAVALLAAVFFRRFLAAEVTLITGLSAPVDAAGWFTLLQNNGLLAITFLNLFDVVDYLLVGALLVIFYLTLGHKYKRLLAAATIIGLAGVTVYLISNTAFPLLYLSNQYAAATSDTQRQIIIGNADALLSNGYPGAIYEGTGGYISLLLIAVSGLMVSAVMYRSKVFNKATACIGMLASALDLAFLAGLVLFPSVDPALLSGVCLPAAGLLLMVWHLLIGIKYVQLSRTQGGASK